MIIALDKSTEYIFTSSPKDVMSSAVAIVTDVVFLINFDVNELTRSSISASRRTKVVLDFILSGFKPKVGNSLSFVNFRK